MRDRCPKCGCKAYNKQGNNRHKCKACGCKYTVNPIKRTKIVYPVCPYCGSSNVINKGYSKTGVHKFLCNDCFKNFQESRINHKVTEHEKSMTRLYVTKLSNNYTAKLLHLDAHTVKNIIKSTDKHNTVSLLEKVKGQNLTNTELNIYKLLRSRSRIFSTEFILNKLGLSKNNLRVYVHKLNNKLGYNCINNIYGKGYRYNAQHTNTI